MHAGQSFVTDAQAAKPVQPCDGSLDHPARLAQSAAVFVATPRDLGLDASLQQRRAMGLGIVGPVGLHQSRFALGCAPFAGNGGYGIHKRQQLRDIVTIGLGQNGRERNALRVDEKVVLRTGTAAIGWVRSRFFPAPRARMEELSAIAREKSIRSASRSLESRVWCRRVQTPALCQALSRRQQVTPEPHPISSGSIFQGMPERRTKMIPVSAARSDTPGKRPGCFLRRRFGRGNSASIVFHNWSSISGLDIAPHKGKQCRS
jgi:hypothetical protein